MNRAFVGCCGSGKTYALQEAARAAVESSPWSFLVLDVNGEWPHREVWRGAKLRFARVHNAAQAARKLAEGVRVVCVRPTLDAATFAQAAPFAGIGNELARVAIEHPGGVVLVLPEAHQVAREHRPLPAFVGVIAHRWRHVGALVWFDTQSPRQVSKELFDACGVLNVFALGGWKDWAVMREIGGPPLELAARRLSESVGASANGCRDPGWHLRVAPGETPSRWTAFRVSRGKLHTRSV